MSRSRKLLIAAAAALALGAGGAALAQAMQDSPDTAAAAQAERARQAALEIVGGGEAVKVERVDRGRAVWEVEVLKAVPGLDGWLGKTTLARRGEVLLDANLDLVTYTNIGTGEVR